ncbi:MAG: NAD(P)-dependent oxidoreductase [Actinobacteria bacterium]|nr:NAD(P)-dependent oxidoreductase [Actinomycetota bacterium]
MKVALIGASGFIGSCILNEAINRGHHVTGIVRNPDKLPKKHKLTSIKCDASNTEDIARAVLGHDAVICAINPGRVSKENPSPQIETLNSIIEGMKKSKVKRLLVVGGAGSLEVAPNLQLVDSPEFPSLWRNTALATREMYNILRNETELDWCFLCPSAIIEHGQRTGRFRLSVNKLLKDKNGQSKISLEDYSVAMIDELEDPKHIYQRFTVGY